MEILGSSIYGAKHSDTLVYHGNKVLCKFLAKFEEFTSLNIINENANFILIGLRLEKTMTESRHI